MKQRISDDRGFTVLFARNYPKECERYPLYQLADKIKRLPEMMNRRLNYYVVLSKCVSQKQKEHLLRARSDGLSIRWIPYYQKTRLILMAATNSSSSSLCFIPEDMLTQELIIKSLQRSTVACAYIPKRMMTQEIICYLFHHHAKQVRIVQDHPDEFLLDDDCYKYLVEERSLTREVIMYTISRDIKCIIHFPRYLITQDMIDEVIRINGGFIYVPSQMIPEERAIWDEIWKR